MELLWLLAYSTVEIYWNISTMETLDINNAFKITY